MPNYSACNACSSSLLHSINFHWLSQAFVSGVFHFTGFYFQRCLLINAEKCRIPIGSGLHRKLAWPTVMQVYRTWQQPFFSKLRMWVKKKERKSYYMKKQVIISVSVSVKHQNFYIFYSQTEKSSVYNIFPHSLWNHCDLFLVHDCIGYKRRTPYTCVRHFQSFFHF